MAGESKKKVLPQTLTDTEFNQGKVAIIHLMDEMGHYRHEKKQAYDDYAAFFGWSTTPPGGRLAEFAGSHAGSTGDYMHTGQFEDLIKKLETIFYPCQVQDRCDDSILLKAVQEINKSFP